MRFKNKMINNNDLKLLFKTLPKIVNLLTKILKLIKYNSIDIMYNGRYITDIS
jgi:hypothetical protein